MAVSPPVFGVQLDDQVGPASPGLDPGLTRLVHTEHPVARSGLRVTE